MRLCGSCVEEMYFSHFPSLPFEHSMTLPSAMDTSSVHGPMAWLGKPLTTCVKSSTHFLSHVSVYFRGILYFVD
jgi:hypothetical protein